ncbi:unnamed protein product [Brassica rapa]|uniref:Uncharacterized protein n=2 Tax=Brassica TaxID=3705 RepID=A0A8D9LVB7_BRACM|nr:unnamed protein product [Brassica napus]CAG7888247.1 unnamed protein product [Brassica rapa]
MCGLPWYEVRVYIPTSTVVPPMVESHTIRRHELLFRVVKI